MGLLQYLIRCFRKREELNEEPWECARFVWKTSAMFNPHRDILAGYRADARARGVDVDKDSRDYAHSRYNAFSYQ